MTIRKNNNNKEKEREIKWKQSSQSHVISLAVKEKKHKRLKKIGGKKMVYSYYQKMACQNRYRRTL